jgi:hypothetical protein
MGLALLPIQIIQTILSRLIINFRKIHNKKCRQNQTYEVLKTS